MDALTQLYERYRNGDRDAFNEFVLSSKDGLIYYIKRFVKDPYTAEDISEDVYVSLLMHPKKFSGESSVKTYIYTIGRNKAIDWLRRNKKTFLDDEGEIDAVESESVEEKVFTSLRDRKLHECIDSLKEEYREILHLVYFEGLDLKAAAKVMKKNYKQVENLSFRAKQALKKKLEKEGIADEVR